jgi:hypothetical protein
MTDQLAAFLHLQARKAVGLIVTPFGLLLSFLLHVGLIALDPN